MNNLETIDLDINNYEIEDILNLFQLSYNFDETDLKKVYKTVLMTHPDKSNLNMNVFIFFTKAFKILKEVYNDTNKFKKLNNIKSKQKYNDDINDNETNEKLFINFVKDKSFNTKFNEAFEKAKMKDEEFDEGYDEWLKSNEDIENNINISNVRSLHEYINQKKQTARVLALQEYKGAQVEFTNSSVSHSNLVKEKVDDYSMPGKYEDIKKAFQQSIIPVTEEDFHNKKQYNNVNEFINDRTNIGIIPSKEQSQAILEEQQLREHKINILKRHKYIQQLEEANKSNDIFKTSIFQIQNF